MPPKGQNQEDQTPVAAESSGEEQKPSDNEDDNNNDGEEETTDEQMQQENNKKPPVVNPGQLPSNPGQNHPKHHKNYRILHQQRKEKRRKVMTGNTRRANEN